MLEVRNMCRPHAGWVRSSTPLQRLVLRLADGAAELLQLHGRPQRDRELLIDLAATAGTICPEPAVPKTFNAQGSLSGPGAGAARVVTA